MSSRRERPPAPEPLESLVDAHTHLDACGATDADDVRAILDRAESVGVRAVVTIADDLDAARWAAAAADWDPRVYAAVALHPTRANALTDVARAEIEQLAIRPRVVAIGETGLDLYWPGKLEGCADLRQQREAFAWLRVLRDLCLRLDDGTRVQGRVDSVDNTTTVVWHAFHRRNPA